MELAFQENEGNFMVGGYVINDRLLTSSLSGGRRLDDDTSNTIKRYAIPLGLYYSNTPQKMNSIGVNYVSENVISDDIYDKLYDEAMIEKETKKNVTKKRSLTNKNKKTKRKH